jgi:hypothetical protein
MAMPYTLKAGFFHSPTGNEAPAIGRYRRFFKSVIAKMNAVSTEPEFDMLEWYRVRTIEK